MRIAVSWCALCSNLAAVLQRAVASAGTPLSELPAHLFAAPSSSDLSVASCSLSCVSEVPDVVSLLTSASKQNQAKC